MTHIFDDLDEGSTLWVRQEYEAAIEVFERVLAEDTGNLMVAVRLAVAHSVLGHEGRAVELFDRARQIQPDSIDLQHYLAMHHLRFRHLDLAGPLFEKVLVATPERLPALEALGRIREAEGRLDEAAGLLRRIVTLKESPAAEWVRLGELEMALTDTAAAITAFERARSLQGDAFERHLELGVCYLVTGRPGDAAAALDRVPRTHPGYPMALFKRAQASVLLGEPDWQRRARLAWERSDPTTRRLIESERLFQGMSFR
jgi:tetratricopeptide (TPR) repeat protein